MEVEIALQVGGLEDVDGGREGVMETALCQVIHSLLEELGKDIVAV